MKLSYFNGILWVTLLYSSFAYADPLSSLTLTEAEMQKLKKFFPTEDSSHLTWKGDPLLISLPINKEKRIIFPDNVTADLKSSLNTDQLRLLNNDKSLYFTALKSFATARIFVTLKGTGEVILIDLVTDEHASNSSLYIDVNNNKPKGNGINDVVVANTSIGLERDPSYVELIRFAWQQSYAPESLLKDSALYARAPMHTQKFVSDLVYGDKVIAFPLSSWRCGKFYITNIELRNKYLHTTNINIRKDLCGDWQAATLYPRTTLKPYGNKERDSTTLFLVSLQPFGDTLGVCHGNA